ncbi:MAG: radical SAM protein [Clostridia bacterium]|nr:radical SAM protein [Clostridia bacterium]
MELKCNICPRKCGVNRSETLGFCNAESGTVKISKVMLHHFEEPLISGDEKDIGSGAIFFSNCNLKCCYCQNSEISSGGEGKTISIKRLSEIFRELESAGAFNINLVTPTHYTAEIVEALKIYKPKIPIVWNTSGYENPETIKSLEGMVEIFLTDFKYYSKNSAKKYSLAENYSDFCTKSIIEMRKIIPEDIIKNGLMKRGIIIRHLVLPGHTDDSLKIINWINDNLGNSTIVSLMSQYVPMFKAKNYPEINRRIKPIEYKILVNKLNELQFKNVFVQEFSSANTCFTPDFKTSSEFKI